MLDITDKADSTAGATGELTAAEYNDHKNEIQTAVERSGQTLSAGITDQFAKSLFINGVAANAVEDSGSINSILLSPVTGSPGLTVPNNYLELDGAILQFEKVTANTSTAVTVNFGQTGTELGAKSLVRSDGSLPAAGDVKGLCFVQWDNTADKWVLLRNGADSYKYTISASGAVAPKFANNVIEVDLSGGNISISQLPTPEFLGQRIDFVGSGAGVCDIAAGTGVTNLGIEFTESEGVSFVAVRKSSTLVWELIVDRKTTCKAWVNFDGTGVVAIRDSFNVSSITDNGVGDYTVNFTNPMNDINYSMSSIGHGDSALRTGTLTIKFGTTPTINNARFNNMSNSGAGNTIADGSILSVQIFAS